MVFAVVVGGGGWGWSRQFLFLFVVVYSGTREGKKWSERMECVPSLYSSMCSCGGVG